MGILKEFKTFAIKGNVVDLAVGIIIGAAFSSIVKSLVDDIIMPPVGMLAQGVDFTAMRTVIQQGPTEETTIAIRYGEFLQEIVVFIIVAFAIFLTVKLVNSLRKEENEKPADKKEEEVAPKDIALLTEIRDILKEQKVN